MDRNTLWRLGTALPLVLSCIGLTDCSGNKSTTTTVALPPTAIAVKRYTAGGQLDAGFSGGAVATKIDPSEFEYALAVALQSGKIIAAGHSVLAGQGVIALVRYNADGSLDTAFGSNGIVRTAVPSVNAVATAVVVQPGALPADDKILVAGSTFDPPTGTAGIVLVRYNANGTLDTGFAGGFVSAPIGPGTSMDTASLALQGDGSIVVAGATSTGDFVLRRYGSTGVLDQTFGTNGTTTTHVGTSAMGPAIALQSDGKIVAAGASGSFASPPIKAVLVRYNTNGTLDLNFGGAGGTGRVFTDTVPSSNNLANAVAVQAPGDKIVVAGHAFVDFAADTSDIMLLRYNADGTLDSVPGNFGTNGVVVINLGGFDNAFSVALYPDPDNRIVVSGNTGSGVATSAAVLRFTPIGALDPAFGTGGIVTTSPTGPSTFASANAVLVQPDRSVVVVGYD
jgi:uncharacterized delta-60 repeat protein